MYIIYWITSAYLIAIESIVGYHRLGWVKILEQTHFVILKVDLFIMVHLL